MKKVRLGNVLLLAVGSRIPAFAIASENDSAATSVTRAIRGNRKYSGRDLQACDLTLGDYCARDLAFTCTFFCESCCNADEAACLDRNLECTCNTDGGFSLVDGVCTECESLSDFCNSFEEFTCGTTNPCTNTCCGDECNTNLCDCDTNNGFFNNNGFCDACETLDDYCNSFEQFTCGTTNPCTNTCCGDACNTNLCDCDTNNGFFNNNGSCEACQTLDDVCSSVEGLTCGTLNSCETLCCGVNSCNTNQCDCDTNNGFQQLGTDCVDEDDICNPSEWCPLQGDDLLVALNPSAIFVGTCTIAEHCTCSGGTTKVGDGCFTCAPNPSDFCSALNATTNAAVEANCYYDFESHCTCLEGYLLGDGQCDKDCHNSNRAEATAYCQNDLGGGTGARAPTNFESVCIETLEDCACFDNYDNTTTGLCVLSDRGPSEQLQYVFDDGFGTSPLQKCQGDCDSDNDCPDGLVCADRNPNEAVIGCVGGETDSSAVDYCYDPRPPPSTADVTFSLNTNVTYTINYLGKFQKIQEEGCVSPEPTMIAGCSKGVVSLVNVSDPSIICELATSDMMTCKTVCDTGNCTDIKPFLGSSFDVYPNQTEQVETFGGVYFSCEFRDLFNADGYFTMLGEEASCNGTGANIYQTVQLGAQCGNSSNSYVFLDSMFECNGFANVSGGWSGIYSCTDRYGCSEGVCEQSLPNISVSSDLHRFETDCIASSDGSAIPNVPPPTQPFLGPDEFNATFQVNVLYRYADECNGTMPTLTVACTNGNISLVDSDVSMNCSASSESMIECFETGPGLFGNSSTGALLYSCTSQGQMPLTKAEATGNLPCESYFDEGYFLELQLGAVCYDGTVDYGDHFFECGESSQFVYKGLAVSGAEMACGIESMSLADTETILTAQIETDYGWSVSGYENCLKQNVPTVSVQRAGGNPDLDFP